MFKLFSGRSNKPLAQTIASRLQVPVSNSEVVQFENSEIRIRIVENVINQNSVLVQSIVNPTDSHLMELFFFCDALRRQEAKKVIGVIPYFGYARQDIQHRPGECVSVNVIIRFLESIGFSKIYTINLHDEATEGVFSIPFKNIDAFPLLADEIKKYVKTNDPSKIAIVSPDQGGIERSRRFGMQFFENADFSLCMIEKKRNLAQIHQSKAMDLYGDVKGKTVIIADDMTTSGGTLINAANLCMERGALRVIAAVVHHDFGPDAPKKIQDSTIEKFFTTDTIALQEDQKIEKLVEVSVTDLISEELKHLL